MKLSVVAALVLGVMCACAHAEQDDSFLSLFSSEDDAHRARAEQRRVEPQVTPLDEYAKERLFNSLVIQTRACMAEGVESLRMLGRPRYQSSLEFIVTSCGGPLTSFMVKEGGASRAMARGLVVVYADKALNHIPY